MKTLSPEKKCFVEKKFRRAFSEVTMAAALPQSAFSTKYFMQQ
jgi:hypothetical protein